MKEQQLQALFSLQGREVSGLNSKEGKLLNEAIRVSRKHDLTISTVDGKCTINVDPSIKKTWFDKRPIMSF